MGPRDHLAMPMVILLPHRSDRDITGDVPNVINASMPLCHHYSVDGKNVEMKIRSNIY